MKPVIIYFLNLFHCYLGNIILGKNNCPRIISCCDKWDTVTFYFFGVLFLAPYHSCKPSDYRIVSLLVKSWFCQLEIKKLHHGFEIFGSRRAAYIFSNLSKGKGNRGFFPRKHFLKSNVIIITRTVHAYYRWHEHTRQHKVIIKLWQSAEAEPG